MTTVTPIGDGAEADDLELVRLVQQGDRGALEALVERHRPWIYNVALRMVYLPQDADDATQEILIKFITKLSTFEGRSRLRTWLYRIAVNHLLNMKRTRAEEVGYSFDRYAEGLDSAPDLDLPDPSTVPADVQLLVDEARIGCSMGMLLCLDREQRLVYVLGEIFGVMDTVGAELLEVSRDAFRQRLSRARRDLHQFMDRKCGLVNTANPCRCARKTQAFINAGFVDPAKLLFASAHVTRVRELAPAVHEDVNALDAAYAAVHRDHPFQTPPALAGAIRTLLRQPTFESILDGPRDAAAKGDA
ncbi:MAG TPA: RNA polymerase sigma factor [Vicinamibacterales bacterium]|jgi:RNA polymerase sigma factor (sigma-70 family)|nr:RNA polymerase sigma factor [Vicinamibacterales bacterium]